MDNLNIELCRQSASVPWGFRFGGGIGTCEPLHIARVTPGSVAELAGLKKCDRVGRIGEYDATQVTQSEALNVMRLYGDKIVLTVSKDTTEDTPSTSKSGTGYYKNALSNGTNEYYGHQPPRNTYDRGFNGASHTGSYNLQNGDSFYTSEPHTQTAKMGNVPAVAQYSNAYQPSKASYSNYGEPSFTQDSPRSHKVNPSSVPVTGRTERALRRTLSKESDDRSEQSNEYHARSQSFEQSQVRLVGEQFPAPRDTVMSQFNDARYNRDGAPYDYERNSYSEPRKPYQSAEELPTTRLHELELNACNQSDVTDNDVDSLDGLSDDYVGDCPAKSIRYMGKNIPSKSFKWLQQMVGDDEVIDLAEPPPAIAGKSGNTGRSNVATSMRAIKAARAAQNRQATAESTPAAPPATDTSIHGVTNAPIDHEIRTSRAVITAPHK